MTRSAELHVYRKCAPVVDAAYLPDGDDSPADVIVEALADAKGVDPLDFGPLYEFVDLDAINSFFDGPHRAETDAILGFQIDIWNVFVREDGRIRICDGTQRTEPEPVFGSSPV